MARIRFEGLEELDEKLRVNATLNDVKKVVRKNGQELQSGIQGNADFTQGYQTGQTKRSVRLDIKNSGLTAESGPTTEYAPYVNFGTRFMNAQPFVTDAYNEQVGKFKSDMQKLVR